MSYGQNPYGQNPYGNNPYGAQPGPPGPGQPGPGQPGPGQPAWGAPQQQPGQGPSPWGPPGGPAGPGPGGPGGPGYGPPPGQGGPGVGGPGVGGPGVGGPGQWGPPAQPQGQPSAPPAWGQPPAQPVPPTPVPEPEPRKVTFTRREMLVATTDGLPGHEISEVLGDVFGVVTRPRDMKASADQAAILTETRQAAVAALVEMATLAEADAVVGLRFDGGKISETASELTAYGTAVKLVGGNPAASSENPDEGAEADSGDGVDSGENSQPGENDESGQQPSSEESSNPFVESLES